MIKAGFYKQNLEEVLLPTYPVMEEKIEAVALYLSDESSRAIWMTLDFMDFNLLVVNTLKDSIHTATGIDKDNIHIVTTHNHGGGTPDWSSLAKLCADCASLAMENAVNVRVRHNKGECGRQVSIIRRKYVPELDGMTTLFYGASEKDLFNSAPFVENAVENIREGTLSYTGARDTTREFSPFESGDKTVFVVEFCNENDETIGSIVRFSAHAVCSNRPEVFSSDYPWHIRKNMEDALGGICVFWNGPCGDIAPGMTDKSDGTQVTLGKYIADTALSLLKDAEFDKCNSFKDESISISLPVRAEIIENNVPISSEMPTELPEIRRYLENLSYKETLPFLREKYLEGEEKVGDMINISFGLLKIGSLCIAAFPGETFSTTAKEFCCAFADDSICTITEHGRTVMYIPPKQDWKLGGYETVCRVTKPESEEILLKNTISAYENFIKEN